MIAKPADYGVVVATPVFDRPVDKLGVVEQLDRFTGRGSPGSGPRARAVDAQISDVLRSGPGQVYLAVIRLNPQITDLGNYNRRLR